MVNHFHRQLRNPRVQLRLPCDRSHDDQLSGLPLRQAVTKNSFDQIPYEVHLSTWDRALQLSRSRGEKGISGVETQDKWGSVFAETFDSVSGCITFGVKVRPAASEQPHSVRRADITEQLFGPSDPPTTAESHVRPLTHVPVHTPYQR